MAAEGPATPDTPEALARALWAGPLAARDAPASRLAQQIRAGIEPDRARATLRTLQAAGLPAHTAIQAARARWPDDLALALMAAEGAAYETAAPCDAALAHLDALIARTGRGGPARARLLWRLGRWQAARDSLAGPGAGLAQAALVARLDLALRAGDWAAAETDLAALAGRIGAAHHLALSLRLTWARDGAAALVCRLGPALAGRPEALPPAPGLWRVITDLLQRSPDAPRAARALARLQALAGPDHPAAQTAALEQALAQGETAQARALLDRLPDAGTPWRWPPRRHILSLRAGLAQARDMDQPQPLLAALAGQAAAACRLHARHAGLTALGWTCRLAAGDWAGLEDTLRACPPGVDLSPPAALRLGRIGQPDAGLALLGAHPPPPEAPAPIAARHRLARLQLARACGQTPATEAPNEALNEALNAGMTADLSSEQALALIEAGQPRQALALLRDPLRRFPRRPALWLAHARAQFRKGDFRQAARALARFNHLNARARPGRAAGDDLRDMLITEAVQASRNLAAQALAGSSATIMARLGRDRLGGSAALSAWLLARASAEPGHAEAGHEDTPDGDPLRALMPASARPARAIPPRLLHYWEGPPSPPVARILAAWAGLHPGLTQTLHDAESAQAWLARHDARAADLFSALAGQPAARADILRLALLAHEGGIWADIDEAPRAPVSDWLQGVSGVFVLEPGFGTVANNFIAAAPGLAVITQARALALQAVQARLAAGEAVYPWRDSGPGVMTRALLSTLPTKPEADADPLRLLPPARYLARVATNLPLPHKRSALHWR